MFRVVSKQKNNYNIGEFDAIGNKLLHATKMKPIANATKSEPNKSKANGSKANNQSFKKPISCSSHLGN